jgi:hypothetical protein
MSSKKGTRHYIKEHPVAENAIISIAASKQNVCSKNELTKTEENDILNMQNKCAIYYFIDVVPYILFSFGTNELTG